MDPPPSCSDRAQAPLAFLCTIRPVNNWQMAGCAANQLKQHHPSMRSPLPRTRALPVLTATLTGPQTHGVQSSEHFGPVNASETHPKRMEMKELSSMTDRDKNTGNHPKPPLESAQVCLLQWGRTSGTKSWCGHTSGIKQFVCLPTLAFIKAKQPDFGRQRAQISPLLLSIL